MNFVRSDWMRSDWSQVVHHVLSSDDLPRVECVGRKRNAFEWTLGIPLESRRWAPNVPVVSDMATHRMRKWSRTQAGKSYDNSYRKQTNAKFKWSRDDIKSYQILFAVRIRSVSLRRWSQGTWKSSTSNLWKEPRIFQWVPLLKPSVYPKQSSTASVERCLWPDSPARSLHVCFPLPLQTSGVSDVLSCIESASCSSRVICPWIVRQLI